MCFHQTIVLQPFLPKYYLIAWIVLKETNANHSVQLQYQVTVARNVRSVDV
jgi:hypothetical protein